MTTIKFDDKQMAQLLFTLTRLSYGDSSPTGLEGVGIALAGNKLEFPIGESISQVASAIEKVAEALMAIADGVNGTTDYLSGQHTGGIVDALYTLIPPPKGNK